MPGKKVLAQKTVTTNQKSKETNSQSTKSSRSNGHEVNEVSITDHFKQQKRRPRGKAQKNPSKENQNLVEEVVEKPNIADTVSTKIAKKKASLKLIPASVSPSDDVKTEKDSLKVSPSTSDAVKTEESKTIASLKKKPSNAADASKKGKKGRKTTKKEEVQTQTLYDHFPVRRSRRAVGLEEKRKAEEELHTRIRKGIEVGVEVTEEGEKGKGVRAIKEFSAGDFVCEYSGELITKKEADLREVKYGDDPKFGCYMYYFKHKDVVQCVDATLEGRIGRYINHAAKKNNLVSKNLVVDDIPRIAFFAKRNIEINEELLYDYGDRSKTSILNHPWLK